MKLRRIMSAMLAAALVTSTVAFADDVLADVEKPLNFVIENHKGTYTFTDEELAAYTEFWLNSNNIQDEETIVSNEPSYIFDENSTFTLSDGIYSTNQICHIDVELIDIQKDADGNTSFKRLEMYDNVNPARDNGPFWFRHYGCKFDYFDPEYFAPTKSGSEVIASINNLIDSYKWVPTHSGDAGYAYEDIDMLVLWIYTDDAFDNQKLDENGYCIKPDPVGNSYLYTEWLFTESGAKTLNAEMGGTSAPETPEAPAADYEIDVTEALTAEDITDVIAANADSDVVINGENGVSFKFAKGTMAAVDGVEIYDFTSTISTDLADAVSDKLTEDNFVMSIDYAYSGKLPAKAEITIPVGAEYAGKTLYYSRVLENGVKLIDSAEVDENGFITVTQDSCSDYILTTEDISADAAGSTEGADGEDKNSAETGAQGVAAAAGIALAAGAAVLFSRKRK